MGKILVISDVSRSYKIAQFLKQLLNAVSFDITIFLRAELDQACSWKKKSC